MQLSNGMLYSKLEHAVNIFITPVRNHREHLFVSAGLDWLVQNSLKGSTSMKTPGMAVFKQQNVEDFYEVGEVLGR